MTDFWTPLPASVLAFVTTIHAALVVLRKHRIPPGSFPWAVLPSVALAVGPWVFPSLAGNAIGLFVHLVWFAACEALIPQPARVTSGSKPVAVNPQATVSSGSATAPRVTAGAAKSKDFSPLPVLAVFDESPTIRTFRMARPPGFDFEAGQFLTVRVQVDGKAHVRCYSISSPPEASGYIEISVKRLGLVSGMLHATVRPGSRIMVRPPAGKFTYPAHDDRPVVLIAGGVGITPLISMLRHAMAAEPGRPVTLLYSARGEAELAFWEELGWLARRHQDVRAVATLTGAGPGWSGRVGRVNEALLAELVPEAQHAVFMICGPAEMIHDARNILGSMGVPAAQIRSEVFQPALAIGARGSHAEGAAAETPFTPQAAAVPQLSLVKSKRSVAVSADQTLLEAAEGVGVAIPSLCRSGVCRTCRTRLVAGEVQCTSDALDDADRSEGWTLPCVAWAKTDCSLDA